VHFAELTDPEQRVLGCLIEKRWTTPDQYPLSLNALRLACNQATNRDPVTDYDEGIVRQAAERLGRYGLVRLASGHASRSIKYRHLAEEALGLGKEELALLAVLLLRGPQTPGELKSRSERMARLGSLGDAERVMAHLGERGYARRLERRPGQKEDRYEHRLGGGSTEHPPASSATPPAAALATPPRTAPATPLDAAPATRPAAAPGPPPPASGALESRVTALEAEVAALKQELAALRAGTGSGGERQPDRGGRATDDQVGSASPTR
jgi:uncharacterized protein